MSDVLWNNPPSPLTPEWVGDRVEEVRASADDDEQAHGMEDHLHRLVLEAVSRGDCEDVKLCAAVALTTRDIEFARWCA